MNKRNFIKGLASVGLLTGVGVGSEAVEKTLTEKIEEIYRKNGWVVSRSVWEAPVGLYSTKKGRCVGEDEIDGSWDVERQYYAYPAKGYDGGDIVVWEASSFKFKDLEDLEKSVLEKNRYPIGANHLIIYGKASMGNGNIVFRGAHIINGWVGRDAWRASPPMHP